MTLEEAINKAAEELPEGWMISVYVERGAAWVILEDEEGLELGAGPIDCDESLIDCVLRLIDEAIECV